MRKRVIIILIAFVVITLIASVCNDVTKRRETAESEYKANQIWLVLYQARQYGVPATTINRWAIQDPSIINEKPE